MKQNVYIDDISKVRRSGTTTRAISSIIQELFNHNICYVITDAHEHLLGRLSRRLHLEHGIIIVKTKDSSWEINNSIRCILTLINGKNINAVRGITVIDTINNIPLRLDNLSNEKVIVKLEFQTKEEYDNSRH